MQPLTSRKLDIAEHSITLELPTDPEQLLRAAAEQDSDSDPYWGILWDTAIETAGCVLRSDWPTGRQALEVGCGAGLVGIAGLLSGLDVTFSDLVPEAVELALHNAAVNGFPDALGRTQNWNDASDRMFDILFASDVLYETSGHQPLLKFARQTLKPGGCFWIGDPGRQQAQAFLKLAADHGWTIDLRDRELRRVDVPTIARFRLIVLT